MTTSLRAHDSKVEQEGQVGVPLSLGVDLSGEVVVASLADLCEVYSWSVQAGKLLDLLLSCLRLSQMGRSWW